MYVPSQLSKMRFRVDGHSNVGNEAASHLLELLKSRDEGKSLWKWNPQKPVYVMMYFDEAHHLAQDGLVHFQNGGMESPRTAYMGLMRALDDLSDKDIFSIFISTNPLLSGPSSSRRQIMPSRGRGADIILQPAFIELPFDQWEENCIVREGKHTLDEVCQVEYMVRFGRPL